MVPENPKIIQNPQLFYGCLHFRYNGKKYLYGVSQQLATCGEETNLLSKLNGTYEPTEKQKKEKSTLLLKKQKTILKIDYIIIPRKACQHQYLWHFTDIIKKLTCRHFLILPLTRQQRKNKDAGIDFTTKKRIMSLLTEEQEGFENGLSISQFGYKFESFKDHQNVIKKVAEKSEKGKGINRANQYIEEFQKSDEIVAVYEDMLNEVVQQIVRKEIYELANKGILKNIQPKPYIKHLEILINTIRHNSNLPSSLQFTQQQIQDHKIQLSQQILRISSSDQVFYPTTVQQLKTLFLPDTSMITVLHRHQVLLINPCNLASWKLFYLGFPLTSVKFVLLTRFSMTFVEFLVAWGAVSDRQKIQSFLQITTLPEIYNKIKLKLKKVFLWTEEMIRSKIAFIIIPSKLQNIPTKISFYPLGFVKLSYTQNQTRQDIWTIKFGNKQLLYMNQLLLVESKWLSQFDCIIFDKIHNDDTKKQLYEMSSFDSNIKKKFIYNCSNSSKFRHKYFYHLEESFPIVTISSQIKIQQTFVPYFTSFQDQQRYQKVKLQPGESINCLGRNILVIEGLIAALYQRMKLVEEIEGKFQGKKMETRVQLYCPAGLIKNGNFIDLRLNKIRNIKEIVCLKQALILVQETQNQIFYQNLLGKTIQINNITQKYLGFQDQTPFKRQFASIPATDCQISSLSSNTLASLLNKNSSNFCHSHTNSSEEFQNQTQQKVESIQPQSPYHKFNQLFKKIMYESGQIINLNNQKVYFVLKGLLKWDDRNDQGPKAKNSAFIGNLSFYYEEMIKSQNQGIHFEHSEDNQLLPIKVIKDSYVLEADMKILHEKFFVQYPEIAYWIMEKGSIFY